MSRLFPLPILIAAWTLVAVANAAPSPSASVAPGQPSVAPRPGPVDQSAPLPKGHPTVTAPASGPVDPSAPLPKGHPSVTAAAPGPVDPGAPLPKGHPVVGATAVGPTGTVPDSDLPPDHPRVAPPPENAAPAPAPENTVAPAPDLGAGVVEVLVVDEHGAPIAARSVALGILKQEVAEGDSRERKAATTDVRGVARFEALPTGTAYSFRAVVESGPASYVAGPFRLAESTGQRATIHVFPVVRDLRTAMVGVRGVVFVQPREDVFAVEVNLRVLNVGTATWVPEGVTLDLPPGAKAFRANEAMTDTRVERDKAGGLHLLGTYSPGEHEVGFQFQLENLHERSREVTVPLPPRVFELRVFAERARDMTLSVRGFPEAQPMDGDNGTPLLGTGRRLGRGEPPINAVNILLDDLPVPSSGRWIAALIAGLVALLGFLQLGFRKDSARVSRAEAKEAQALILDELVTLERMSRRDQIGARTYQEARGELLDAMARLGSKT